MVQNGNQSYLYEHFLNILHEEIRECVQDSAAHYYLMALPTKIFFT